MKDRNLIEDIVEGLKLFNFDKVCIFPHYRLRQRTLAAALALKEFLNQIGVKADIVVNKDTEYILDTMFEDVVSTVTDNRYIGISIDCDTVEETDSPNLCRSYVVFNICSPSKKGKFGVRNYTKSSGSCSGEVIYSEIKEYCEKHKIKISKDIANVLYLSIIDGTKKYERALNPETLQILKELLEKKVDYTRVNYQYSKKDEDVLKCEQIIRDRYQFDNKYPIAYAIIDEPETLDGAFPISSYEKALDGFRNIEEADIWLLFFTRDGDFYHTLIFTKDVTEYNAHKIAIKNNGVGTKGEAYCKIIKEDIDKVIKDARVHIDSFDKKKKK